VKSASTQKKDFNDNVLVIFVLVLLLCMCVHMHVSMQMQPAFITNIFMWKIHRICCIVY